MNSATLHKRFLHTGKHQHAEEWLIAREQEEKQSPNDDGVMFVAGAYTIVMGTLFGIGGAMWLKEIFNRKYGGLGGPKL